MKEHLSGNASPTERTMAWLREKGYTVAKVEQRITRTITRDFCGFADILAFKEGETGATAVQATSTPHLKDRMRKVLGEAHARTWIKCGNGLWLVGWAKAARGKRQVYQETVIRLHGAAFDAVESRP